MDTLLRSIKNKQNVIITSLAGHERSRLLLKSGLVLLSTTDRLTSFKRIYHVVTWDSNVTNIYNQAKSMAFGDLGFTVAKLYGTESEDNRSDPADLLQNASLIICPMKYMLDKELGETANLSRKDALLFFDGIPLDNLENSCCELQQTQLSSESGLSISPSVIFNQMINDIWSVVLACNKPIDGLEIELGCSFPVVIDQESHQTDRSYRTFSSIITEGPNNTPMLFSGEKITGIHDEVGQIVEECAKRIDSGGIVVFLPSYGKMVEYHNHWQKSGLFDRIGLPYVRENRGDGQFKELLVKFSSQSGKSIALISHRFHQNIQLADCVLSSSTRIMISVGLPYPFTNDFWDSRIKQNNLVCLNEPGRLSGACLFRYRAIEFMNGVIRKCLDDFRYQDCAFFILDKSAAHDRNKFTKEIGDIQVENFGQSITRFQAFCRI